MDLLFCYQSSLNNCQIDSGRPVASSKMATKIRGNSDKKNGSNDSYTIQGRGQVTRAKLVKETSNGQHPQHHVVINKSGKKSVRANPDRSKKINVDK